MNQNLYMAHKNLPHKPMRVHSANVEAHTAYTMSLNGIPHGKIGNTHCVKFAVGFCRSQRVLRYFTGIHEEKTFCGLFITHAYSKPSWR